MLSRALWPHWIAGIKNYVRTTHTEHGSVRTVNLRLSARPWYKQGLTGSSCLPSREYSIKAGVGFTLVWLKKVHLEPNLHHSLLSFVGLTG